MQFAAMHRCTSYYAWSNAPDDVVDASQRERTETHLGTQVQLKMLKEADAYAWTDETIAAVALASKTVPADARLGRDLLPGPAGWWWLTTSRNQPLPFNAMLWSAKSEDTLICLFEMTVDKVDKFNVTALPKRSLSRPMVSAVFPWNYTDSLTEMLDRLKRHDDVDPGSGRFLSEHSELAMRFLVAGSVWLKQRVLMMSSGHVERHRRKQLAREHDAPLPSDVKVIQLRRVESPAHPAPPGADPVDWSCRWIVNGHWRNQPYKHERKLIYIMPFLKGPADRPLKVPTHTVYQVSR